MIYVKYPLSLRDGEELLPERRIYLWCETVRPRWNRFDQCSPQNPQEAGAEVARQRDPASPALHALPATSCRSTDGTLTQVQVAARSAGAATDESWTANQDRTKANLRDGLKIPIAEI
jgi:hypothetical protein